jgi:hypothetical protein
MLWFARLLQGGGFLQLPEGVRNCMGVRVLLFLMVVVMVMVMVVVVVAVVLVI